MSATAKFNVSVRGSGDRAMVFAHGYGCDQNMWRYVAPAFESGFKTVLFDHVGCGGSDLTAYDPLAYGGLARYAEDLLEVARELGLRDAILVGHSVSAMIGALADIAAPDVFSDLVMVGPSPRYIDDDGYTGGFSATQIEELLEFLDDNPLAWSEAMAPAIMGNADRPELSHELAESFCRMAPEVALTFARATFLSDNRQDLPKIRARTLVLQCSEDVIAPPMVGAYVQQHVPNSRLVKLDATGHCPNLSAPAEVIAAIQTVT
jgi:sigma-B regulation protein RsbQ